MDRGAIQIALEHASPEEKIQLQEIITALEKISVRSEARVDFLSFVKAMWPDFIEGEHHRRIAELFNQVLRGELKRLIISLPPRHAIMTGMNIPTISGWKTMESLQVGDFVFGPDGQPTEVLGKSETFKDRQLYRVTTDDGFSLVVDGEHLWTVSLCRKRRHKTFDYTTEQLWERQNGAFYRMGRDGVAKKQNVPPIPPEKVRLPMLPDFSAVERPEADLPVDPYVLGVWLGDGSKNDGGITCCDEDAVVIRKEIERRGYETRSQKTRYHFGILKLKVKLREIGVLHNKHIPEIYMNASSQQRRDLLKGLIDTDGCVSKKGQCYFMQSNKALIDQVRVLLASLGIKNSVCESEAKIGEKSYGMAWRVIFYANDIAHLPRKESRTLKGKRGFGRYIKVEKLDTLGDTQCIRVAREDGLFLAGEGHIVTHNTKSEFASYLLPAWFLGNKPSEKIIQVSNTAELAEGFGRKVRNLLETEEYQDVFPDVSLRSDSKAAARWNTNHGGDYYATGVGAALAGRGATLAICDDLHTEGEALSAMSNPGVYDRCYEWFTTAIRQRLQPKGAIVIVMTRWSERDVIGRILEKMQSRDDVDRWEYFEFPAILPSGKPLWEEFWSLDELLKIKAELPPAKWAAQYQQQPSSDETAIIKREWWREWVKEHPPDCSYTLMSVDTAHSAKQSADFSAMTLWGAFFNEDDGLDHIILLDAWQGKLEFPELKAKLLELYDEHKPDTILVEKTAAGAPLITEFRRMGVPAQEFNPSRATGDKIARLNAIADVFSSGRVWAPPTRWAGDVIHQTGSFPNSRNDDLVDTVSMAMTRFRQGGMVGTRLDRQDDPNEYYHYRNRKAAYY